MATLKHSDFRTMPLFTEAQVQSILERMTVESVYHKEAKLTLLQQVSKLNLPLELFTHLCAKVENSGLFIVNGTRGSRWIVGMRVPPQNNPPKCDFLLLTRSVAVRSGTVLAGSALGWAYFSDRRSGEKAIQENMEFERAALAEANPPLIIKDVNDMIKAYLPQLVESLNTYLRDVLCAQVEVERVALTCGRPSETTLRIKRDASLTPLTDLPELAAGSIRNTKWHRERSFYSLEASHNAWESLFKALNVAGAKRARGADSYLAGAMQDAPPALKALAYCLSAKGDVLMPSEAQQALATISATVSEELLKEPHIATLVEVLQRAGQDTRAIRMVRR